MLSAAVVAAVSADNVTASSVNIKKSRFRENSASAITSRAIVTDHFCARVRNMDRASAESASASPAGAEMHANAAHRLTHAKRQLTSATLFARAMAIVCAEDANVTRSTIHAIMESIATDVQRARAVAVSSRTALSVKCTTKESSRATIIPIVPSASLCRLKLRMLNVS